MIIYECFSFPNLDGIENIYVTKQKTLSSLSKYSMATYTCPKAMH